MATASIYLPIDKDKSLSVSIIIHLGFLVKQNLKGSIFMKNETYQKFKSIISQLTDEECRKLEILINALSQKEEVEEVAK